MSLIFFILSKDFLIQAYHTNVTDSVIIKSFFTEAIGVEKQTALITGTSSGFGLLTAVALAREGYQVIATMRDPAKKDHLLEAEGDERSNHCHEAGCHEP